MKVERFNYKNRKSKKEPFNHDSVNKPEPEFEFERIVERVCRKMKTNSKLPKGKNISKTIEFKCPECGDVVKGYMNGPRSGSGKCSNKECGFIFIS